MTTSIRAALIEHDLRTSRRGSPTVDGSATIPTSVESPPRYLSVSLADIGWLVAFGFVLGLAVALAVFVMAAGFA